MCSCSGDNDAKSSDGTSARTSDDPRVCHHGVPVDRQLLAERRSEADQLGQVPRRRLRRRRAENRHVRSTPRSDFFTWQTIVIFSALRCEYLKGLSTEEYKQKLEWLHRGPVLHRHLQNSHWLRQHSYVKQIDVWPAGCCDMRSSRIITDYNKNEAFSLIWLYAQNGGGPHGPVKLGRPVIILAFVRRKSIHFWHVALCNLSENLYARKVIFTLSFPLTLTIRSQFAPLVTHVQRYVSTKLEVSTAFLFPENRRHGTEGRTDRQRDERSGCNI